MFVWAALVGLVTQFFLNMEIERYTLATGETALTGFSRYWRHWGLVFAILTYFANLWPGWVTSSATLVTYLFGGDAALDRHRDAGRIGLILTLAPVVYVALERAQMLKVAAVLLLFVVAAVFAIGADGLGRPAAGRDPAAASRPTSSASPCCSARWPSPAPAAGRTWCSRNWIRDKGFGMGTLRAAAGQPDHRRAGGGAEHRLRLRADRRRT